MAWRKLTEDDLVASLSRKEVEAYRSSAGDGDDPVEAQLAAVAAFVRGCVRSGGRARLAADAGAVPESLLPASVDYLRWQVLTRQNMPVNESRTRAYEAALALFERVRAGEFVPEADAEEEPPRTAALAPATGRANPEKRLLD